MEGTESNCGVKLTDKECYHKKLMVAILRNLADTPLVLKSGTALFLGYGLTRFSEDLDFDAPRKLNLLNKIKNSIPSDIQLKDVYVKKDTQTVSRYIIDYYIPSLNEMSKLKMEISYRTPVPDSDVYEFDGIRFASVERLIDYKLQAAYDGDTSRSKVRDLYDLHFLVFNYSDRFSKDNAERLFNFSRSPDVLVERYKDNLLFDNILNGKIDLETIALELNEQSEILYKNLNISNISESNNNCSTDVYLNPPIGVKYEEARNLGAKWDRKIKHWYVPVGTDLKPFIERGWKRLSDQEVNELAKAKEEFNELRKSTKSDLSSRKDSHQKLSITEHKKSRGR